MDPSNFPLYEENTYQCIKL